MDRRLFIASLLAVLPLRRGLAAAPQPWRARVLNGGWQNGKYQLGLSILLQPEWKTYWRLPGDAGVPPEFSLSGDNLATFTPSYPLPQRIATGDGGEAIGYVDEVVFPFTLVPLDATRTVALTVRALFGVCKGICIPAQYDETLTLAPTQSGADMVPLAMWQARVPEVVTGDAAPVASARIETATQGPMLVLELRRAVDDIFVEAPGSSYFHKPDFSGAPNTARLAISDLKDVNVLSGQTLRITMDEQGRGLEQSLTIP